MAGQKFIKQVSGVLTEDSAIQSSAGAGDAGKIPALDSTGKFDASFMPVGTASETDVVTASENLAAGDFVNFWNSSGVKVRKADAATAGKEAHGFVLASVASGDPATVFRISQSNNQLTGLTIGAKQYLSAATAGQRTETPPSSAGNIVQMLGVAVSTSLMVFMPHDPITLA